MSEPGTSGIARPRWAAIAFGVLIVAIALGISLVAKSDGGNSPDDNMTTTEAAASMAMNSYLADNFVGLAWYDAYSNGVVSGATASVMLPDDRFAAQACQAVSGWVFDNTNTYDVDSVEIRDESGDLLLARDDISDSCV